MVTYSFVTEWHFNESDKSNVDVMDNDLSMYIGPLGNRWYRTRIYDNTFTEEYDYHVIYRFTTNEDLTLFNLIRP